MLEDGDGYGCIAISYGGGGNSSLTSHKNITILLLKPFEKRKLTFA
jgi:hypothetical protein